MPYIGAGIQKFNTADGLTVSGNASVSGTSTFTGAVTADAGISIDNITIDGSEIDFSTTGDFTVDAGGDIVLDADGADIRLKHAGTEWGRFVDSSNNFLILNPIADKDIIFNGIDGSSEISALTLDMSAGGNAIFNGQVMTNTIGRSDDTNTTIDFPGSDVIQFFTAGSERARFDASGRFMIGASDITSSALFAGTAATGEFAADIRSTSSSYTSIVLLLGSNTNTSDNSFEHLRADIHGVAQRFSVRDSGNVKNTNNSYGALSDSRMKENIIDANSQWDDIKALRVRKYNRIGDEQKELGVIAQELEASGMAGLVEDGPYFDVANNPNEETRKSVKYSILYMKAVKALQEAMTRIETLETEMTALKARVTTLEGE